MAELKGWCRDCDDLCGVVARVEGGRVTEIAGDPCHPITRGRDCRWGRGAPARLDQSSQGRRPQRRAGAAAAVTWEEVLEALAADLAGVIAERGPRAVGLLLGPRAERSPRVLAAVTHMRRALGPIRVFGHRASLEAPWRQATRLVLGAPGALRADLSRAQHLLLLGAGQEEAGCEPGYAGQDLLGRVQGGGGRRAPHLTAVDPRRTALAVAARTHLPARPGTELYLLLGLISTILEKGWWDRQHVSDHTQGLDALEAALDPWSATRSAALCGLDSADLTAEAMRFSRAATAAILPSPQALGTPWAGLVAWAALTLELLTANALKPGGLYAPAAAAGFGFEPAEDLAAALGGGLAALLCMQADPVAVLPWAPMQARLGALRVLAILQERASGGAPLAGYLLPTTSWLEEADRWPASGADRSWEAETAALCQPGADARPAADLLADLTARLASRRGGGSHEGAGRHVPGPTHPAALQVDRARWAVGHADGRALLLPPAIASLLGRHVPVMPDTTFPMALLGGARMARGGIAGGRRDVLLPAECGIPAGDAVRVTSTWGAIEGRAVLDPGLRPDCVAVPADGALAPALLADPWHRDPLGGRVWTDGQPCRVDLVVGGR
jgi:anaerobic selenocysteine-containing dehydrogenase